MAKYSVDKAASHIRRNHPNCPDFAVEYFATEIAHKDWKGVTLGKAVGITMQTHLRHHHTEYDTLLLSGISREEARRRVQPRINTLIRSWQLQLTAEHPSAVSTTSPDNGVDLSIVTKAE